MDAHPLGVDALHQPYAIETLLNLADRARALPILDRAAAMAALAALAIFFALVRSGSSWSQQAKLLAGW
jgi:hypothetical protein